ncbi:MAG: SH3 domain-containing protein [Kiritimatiellae bacterium]|nr:SH3 domain-containing protein [Kiritimatiellia bacterium]
MRQLSLFAWLLALPIVAEALQVQVENAQVREKPSYMGKVIGTLPYGTEITPASTQGAWTQVKLTNGQFAWINSSALTSKRITIRANGAAVNQTASASDLALAGKGFNQSVENEFKRQNPKLNFAAVDQMEKRTTTPAQIQQFIQQGGLKGGVQ